MLIRSLHAVALSWATTAWAAPGDLEALFGPHVSRKTEIASAGTANFTAVVGPRWSTWETPDWSGAIKPATLCDLQKVVSIATASKVPFLATNGGHGPRLGLGKFKGFNINLQSFNTVSVDAAHNRVTVGAGASLGDLVAPVFAAGKEIQTGNSWCPGAIGVTLGGGIGMLMGTHGLMIDALKSVKLLTASGKTVEASEHKNEDLFWAVRGAGQTLGIVTEATLEIYDQTNSGKVVEANFYYDASKNRTLWDLLKTYDNVLPSNLALQLGLLYNKTTDSPSLWVSMWFMGSREEAQPHLDGFAKLGAVRTEILNLTQPEVYYQSVERGVCERGGNITAYTVGLNRTDPAALEAHFADFVALHKANPAYVGQSYVQYYSNKVALKKGADSKTVFPWRDAQAWWLLENVYLDASLEPVIAKWSEEQRDKFHAASGFKDLQVYVNYALGDEGAAAWYSQENLPKLREVKSKWDPDNVFGLGYPLS